MSPLATLCRHGTLITAGGRCPLCAKRQAERTITSGRNTHAWQKRRERVKRRDGQRCLTCARHGSELEQHERLEVHLDPQLRGNHRIAQDEDCRTLCSTCHARAAF